MSQTFSASLSTILQLLAIPLETALMVSVRKLRNFLIYEKYINKQQTIDNKLIS